MRPPENVGRWGAAAEGSWQARGGRWLGRLVSKKVRVPLLRENFLVSVGEASEWRFPRKRKESLHVVACNIPPLPPTYPRSSTNGEKDSVFSGCCWHGARKVLDCGVLIQGLQLLVLRVERAASSRSQLSEHHFVFARGSVRVVRLPPVLCCRVLL